MWQGIRSPQRGTLLMTGPLPCLSERARPPRSLGLLLGLLAAACSSEGTQQDSAPIDPKLSIIEQQVLHPSCTFSSCHGSDSPKDGLSLMGSTYDALVNHRSTELPDRFLVLPADPDGSYLLEKLTRDRPSAGSRMPYASSPLDAKAIAAIRQWIELGAPNN